MAYEWTGESVNPQRAPTSRMTDIDPASGKALGKRGEVKRDVRKPSADIAAH